MSPQRSTLLAFIGVLLAGIPLPALTAARREVPPVAGHAPQTSRPAYATLHWSGRPRELRLLLEGQELIHLSGQELSTAPWEGELKLPASGIPGVEIIAQWPEGSPPQAATLTLEPEGLPTRQSTQWTDPGSHSLHALFLFTW